MTDAAGEPRHFTATIPVTPELLRAVRHHLADQGAPKALLHQLDEWDTRQAVKRHKHYRLAVVTAAAHHGTFPHPAPFDWDALPAHEQERWCDVAAYVHAEVTGLNRSLVDELLAGTPHAVEVPF